MDVEIRVIRALLEVIKSPATKFVGLGAEDVKKVEGVIKAAEVIVTDHTPVPAVIDGPTEGEDDDSSPV